MELRSAISGGQNAQEAAQAGENFGASWLWIEEDSAVKRAARIHVFDIEAGFFVLFAGARAGFSPGEFVDVILGWFGVDIAGDDIPVQVAKSPVEEE